MRTLIPVLCLVACKGEGDPGETPGATGVPVLGSSAHTMDGVVATVIGTDADGLVTPSDLAFHPDAPDELWVANLEDESITIFWDVGTPDQGARTAHSSSSEHFLAYPSGIAMGDDGAFATSPDKFEPTQGGYTDEFFMGPTLWEADRDSFDGGDVSHLDMLHNSPKAKGIAWDGRNRYWVFDGYHDSLTLYDFHDDHGLGGTDHDDGEVVRYVEGEVKGVGALPSHLEVDRETGLLYVSDSGNDRIAILDTTTGQRGDIVSPNFDGTDQYEMVDATISTLVDLAALGRGRPVGLALSDGLLFVSTVDPQELLAFDLAGNLIDWLELDRTAHGIEFAADGSLYLADPVRDEVVRIEARP